MKPTRSRRPPPHRGSGSGFVLVIVLALLVVLTLLAAAAAASSSRAVEEAQADSDRFSGEADMRSTQDTVLFILATHHRNIAGVAALPGPPISLDALEEDTDGSSALPTGRDIRLDGTAYTGLGDAQFALQDDGGLLSPNWAPPTLLQAFYTSRGVPATEWANLDAKRLDYQDPDSLRRLGGAEAEQYLAVGRPPPPNRPVTTPLEFRRIMQWDEMLAPLDDDAILRMFSSHRGGAINLNSAPPEVLSLIPGMDIEHAKRLAMLRKDQPIVSIWQARESFPIAPFMEEMLTLFPSRTGNLILWNRHAGVKKLAHWSMTPYAVGGPPWQIDYEVILSRGNQPDDAVAEASAAPLLAETDDLDRDRDPRP